MGKSYANFMCKKFFHPASYDNIKRVWMAQQRTDAEKSRQEGLRTEYEREQEIYENRQLMGDEKVKHGLTFIYEPPKGFKTEEQKKDKDGEPEYKFEWQRGAPREAYAKNMEVTDQPFGIAVRNVKCIRCHQWGHVNTDRECPLFNNNKDDAIAGPSTNKMELLEDMRRDGYVLKQNALDRKVDRGAKNQQIIPSDDEEGIPEAAFLKSLSTKDKKKLLKKLNEMEKPDGLRKSEKKNKKAKQQQDSSDESDDSSSGEERRKRRKKKKAKKHQSSDTTDTSDDERKQKRYIKKKKIKKEKSEKKRKKYSESDTSESSDESSEKEEKRQHMRTGRRDIDRNERDKRRDDDDSYEERRKDRSHRHMNGSEKYRERSPVGGARQKHTSHRHEVKSRDEERERYNRRDGKKEYKKKHESMESSSEEDARKEQRSKRDRDDRNHDDRRRRDRSRDRGSRHR